MTNNGNASDDWFDMTPKMNFEYPSGNQLLNWKDKGFGTVIDLLTVF